jgi:hypothetical protein
MGAIGSLYGTRSDAQVKGEKEKRDAYAKELGMNFVQFLFYFKNKDYRG